MGIALQIIDIATASIPPHLAGVQVTRVNLKVGKLSAVIPENLRFCFDVAVGDTPLAGARLHIEEIPVTARCNECGHHWTLAEPAFACPACTGAAIKVLSGRELDIESIEINEELDHAATRG
jgi:hydrogenase nickel incorporation protein HypA/HybF